MASFDEVIPPGKAGTIRASIHTAGFRGPIGKVITVTHDDPAQGPVQLSVRANVVASVEVLPFPRLALAPRLKGFSTPALLLVRKESTESGALRVSDVKATVPWLVVTPRVVKTEEPPAEGLPAARPGDVVLSVAVKGAPKVGTHSESFTFSTGFAREATVTVPVSVVVRPPVHLQPPDLVLTPDPTDPKKASGQILAAVREDLDPKDLVVTANSPAFSVRIDPPGDRAFRVYVDWARGQGAAPTEGTVTFREGSESISLPVRVKLPPSTP